MFPGVGIVRDVSTKKKEEQTWSLAETAAFESHVPRQDERPQCAGASREKHLPAVLCSIYCGEKVEGMTSGMKTD